MNSAKQPQGAVLFCRRCGYPLTGLTAQRCPECGTVFDPASPRTYVRHPGTPLRRRWARRATAVSISVVLAFSIPAAFLCYEWRHERRAISALQSKGIAVRTEPVGPEWTRRAAGPGLGRLFDRAAIISASGETLGDDEWAGMSSLSHAWYLDLTESNAADAQMRYVGRLHRLRHLRLSGTGVTDAGLAHLRGLASLESLNLSGTQISDAGLEQLGGVTSITSLDLFQTRVSDRGARHVAALRYLTRLDLGATDITDAGVVHLAGLSHLSDLSIAGTGITDEGLRHLAALGCLRRLDLSHTRITESSIGELRRLKSLEWLSVRNTPLADDNASRLALAVPQVRIEYLSPD